jgi:hypothetical protein
MLSVTLSLAVYFQIHLYYSRDQAPYHSNRNTRFSDNFGLYRIYDTKDAEEPFLKASIILAVYCFQIQTPSNSRLIKTALMRCNKGNCGEPDLLQCYS